MPGAAEILDVLELVYAAAAMPSAWPAALETLTTLLCAEHTILFAMAGQEAAPLHVAGGLDVDSLTRGVSLLHLCDDLPVAPHRLPLGVATTRSELIRDDEFERSAYYNECVRHSGGFHSVQLRNERTSTSLLVIGCRSRRAGDFDVDAKNALNALTPHLTTALDLHRRLCAADHPHGGLTAMLDRLGHGAILTDATGIVLFANAPAQRIAAAGDGLVLDGPRLAATSPLATRQLRVAITAALRIGETQRLSLSRRSTRAPLLLEFMPIDRLGASVSGTAAPRVAVFLTESDAPFAIDDLAVAEFFGLTRREGEIAALLTCGYGPSEISRQLGLGLGTVRYHLTRVFDKTDAHSQAKLVAMLRGFTRRSH